MLHVNFTFTVGLDSVNMSSIKYFFHTRSQHLKYCGSVLCNVMCQQCDVIGLEEEHWEVHALGWGTGESMFHAPPPLMG